MSNKVAGPNYVVRVCWRLSGFYTMPPSNTEPPAAVKEKQGGLDCVQISYENLFEGLSHRAVPSVDHHVLTGFMT